MTANTRVLYAKFKKKENEWPTAYIVSENKGRVDAWVDSKKKKTPPQQYKPNLDTLPGFKRLTLEFVADIDALNEIIPLMMFVVGRMVDYELNISLYQLALTKGTSTNKHPHYETFEIPERYVSTINRYTSRMDSQRSGVNSIPNMFILGLVSLYDAFLSNLLRLIFNTKPEMLSSSERNISFKDLVWRLWFRLRQIVLRIEAKLLRQPAHSFLEILMLIFFDNIDGRSSSAPGITQIVHAPIDDAIGVE